jgi:peroxiredoxin/uncharacterized membrane protein YphA (DoxX/SURF4 family)/heme exporter protein D
MHAIALGARALLAIVLGVAAVAKALDQPGARRALAGFGLPERAIAPAALLLPLAEFAAAVALLFRPSARWCAVAAVCLLTLFIASIARAMARGEAPDCHCFGQLSSAPAGRPTLIRNVLLTVPAVFVVAYGPGEGVDEWVSGHSGTEHVAIAAGLCAAVLAVLLMRSWRQNRRLLRDIDRRREIDELIPPGLPVGTPAPAFSLPRADGATISLAALLGPGRPVALVFVGGGCASCVDMLPDLARWQGTLAERITIALVSGGSMRENEAMTERHGLENVLVQDGREVARPYRVRATPSVVIVTPDGRIASRTHSTRAMTEAVIRNALHSRAAPVLRVVTVSGDERSQKTAAANGGTSAA